VCRVAALWVCRVAALWVWRVAALWVWRVAALWVWPSCGGRRTSDLQLLLGRPTGSTVARIAHQLATDSAQPSTQMRREHRLASKSDKTEKATPQRRQKAREEGQVAKSAEVSVFVGLGMGILAMRVFLPAGLSNLSSEARTLFANLDTDMVVAMSSSTSLLSAAVMVVVPFLGAAVIGALGAGFGMTRFNFSVKALKPKIGNLSLKKGIKKFAPAKAGWELARNAIKISLLFGVAWGPMRDLSSSLGGAQGLDTSIGLLVEQSSRVLMRALVLAFVIGAADYLYNIKMHEQDLKMEKHEVKQENKNTEGDPHVKGERRRRQAEMSRNRMMSDVARADVVLVNPTDYAIALRYDPSEVAPKVLAKGADHIAARIRAEATRNGVPIHADIPLCRALYRQVKVGDYVPRGLFDAIAVVLVWAYRRNGKAPTATADASASTPASGRVALAGGR
jgi:flagellar biosynthetic protein FlhB